MADDSTLKIGKDAFKLGAHREMASRGADDDEPKEGNSNNVTSADSECDEDSSGMENRRSGLSRSKSDGTFHALSGLYAQIVVVVAAILVFTEVLHKPLPLLFFHGYLFTYLVAGGIICILGVYVGMLRDKCPQFMNGCRNENSSFSTPFMRHILASDISVYLRIGAAVFGLGTLISNCLEVGSIFTAKKDCVDGLNIAQTMLRCIFTFLQLHFLFMNAKEILNYLGWFRHAALMHLVATNVALWIRLVLWESSKDWLEAIHERVNASEKYPQDYYNFTVHTITADAKSTDVNKHRPRHITHTGLKCSWFRPDEGNTEDLIQFHLCLQNSTIGSIWERSMPYLYPFVIQYCLVAAGVIYIIWSSLHSPRLRLQHLAAVSVYGRSPDFKNESYCAGSTKGLFLGLLTLVAGIITLILFIVLAEDKDITAIIIIGSLRCGILGLSTLTPAIGVLQIRKMKGKTKKQSRLAELLQRTGMLAVYVVGICNMIVGGTHITTSKNLLLFLDGILMVLQACIQSLFIHQITKKRLGPSNHDEKPGRDVVMFLVFSNMVLWLFESFTTQHEMSSVLQKKFYGEVAWSVMSRIFLPLVIFYRFHSAVALMEAWHKSYKVKQN